MKKYEIQVECGNEVEIDFGNPHQWKNYGTIIGYGDTLEELLEDASVDIMDQDGGELAVIPADAEWMQELITKEFKRKYEGPNTHTR